MSVECRVISIGTLSRNSFWNESDPVRTPHATTTLIVSGNKRILVDPALPGPILDARLFERVGVRIAEITTVFLTTFRAAHRAGLPAFDRAKWFIHEREKEFAQRHLEEIRQLSGADSDLELLNRCDPAPEKLANVAKKS